MRDWLNKLLDIQVLGPDQTMLKQGLANLAKRLDFEAYAFLKLQPGRLWMISNHHPDWQAAYQERDYRFIDPAIRQARRKRCAFFWKADHYARSATKKERGFLAHAADYRILAGITIPVATPNRSMSILTLTTSNTERVDSLEIDVVAAAAAVGQLHARIEQLATLPEYQEHFRLSWKQTTYVQWLSLGKTVEDTADIEGVKYNTVRRALADARERYDLCNNTQLVALAIRHRLI